MNKNFFLIVLTLGLFLSVSGCVSSQKQKKKASLHHQMALSLMRKCKYPSALAALKKALKNAPKDSSLHHSIALLYFQFKKPHKTLEHLKKALRINPGFTSARVHLSRTLIELNKIDKALKELEKSREDLTYPHPENIHAHLGIAYYKKNDFVTAAKHFSAARTIKEKDCSTALYQGKSLYFQDRFDRALAVLEPAKKWCEKNPALCQSPSFDPYFFSALAYKKTGQAGKALLNLELFLKKAKESEYLKQAEQYKQQWKDQGLGL